MEYDNNSGVKESTDSVETTNQEASTDSVETTNQEASTDSVETANQEASKKVVDAAEACRDDTATPPVEITDSTTPPVGFTDTTTPPVGLTDTTKPQIGITDSTTPSVGMTDTTTPPVGLTDTMKRPVGLTETMKPPVGLTDTTTLSVGKTDDEMDGSIKYAMPSTDQPVYQVGQLDEEDVDFITGSPEESNKYNMDHRRRGIFVILNNKTFQDSSIPDRHGTDVDASNLFHTFTNLGFTVYLYSNKKRQEMISILHTASQQNHKDADCFGCAILSHGSDGVVYGTDEVVRVDEIAESFRGHRCPQLLGKPKLFFIQACRGVKIDHGVDFTDGDEFDSEIDNNLLQLQRIPTEADFLFAYSTAPGYFSWRHSVKGSWFVQALCRVIKRNATEKEIMWILTEVNKTVAYEFESSACQPFMRRKKQVPSIVSMLTGELYFPKKENTLETLV